jgi:uncharacterized SAM-binding protein YcdF (DUF218 family)
MTEALFLKEKKASAAGTRGAFSGKTALSLVFFALTIWIALPAVSGILHSGMLFCFVTGALSLVLGSPRLFRLVFVKSVALRLAAACLLTAGSAVFIALFSLLLYGGLRPSRPGCTLIVLGCQVNGEQPSLMLRQRIDAAAEYALKNPGCAIIASGGQGGGEAISEAECIRRGLIQAGVDAGRIYLEDRSLNTEQNLRYSAGIIRENGLGTDVAIATSRFHQYRALCFAKKAGLTACPVSCDTSAWLAPGYWLREIIGLLRLFALGY